MERDLIITYFTFETLIVTIVAFVILAFLLYRSRAKIKRMNNYIGEIQKSVELSKNEISASEYIERQLANSTDALQAIKDKNLGAETDTHAIKMMAIMRNKWLEAESACFSEDGNTDIGALTNELMPLYRYLATKLFSHKLQSKQLSSLQNEASELRRQIKNAASSKNLSPQDLVVDNSVPFSEFYRQISEHRKTILELYKRLREQTINNGTALIESGDIGKNITAAEINTLETAATVEALEEALTITKDKYNAARYELLKLKSKLCEAGMIPSNNVDSSVLVIQNSGSEVSASISDEVYLEVQQAYENSSKELGRLQNSNSQQRSIILQLESKLSGVHMGDNEYDPTTELVVCLKQQLLDSEMCTKTLESVTEDLRKKIEMLRETKLIDNSEEGLESQENNLGYIADSDKLELTNIQDSYNKLLTTVKIIRSTTEEQNIEKLGKNLLDICRIFCLDGAILITGVSKTYWCRTKGNVSDTEKKLLQSVQPNLAQPWVEVQGGVLLLFNHCRLLLSKAPPKKEDEITLFQAISAINNVTALIEELQGTKQQQVEFEKLSANACKVIQHISIQAKYQTEEKQRVVQAHLKELQELTGNLPLSDVQRVCISAMIQDHKIQMDILIKGGEAVGRLLLKVNKILSVSPDC